MSSTSHAMRAHSPALLAALPWPPRRPARTPSAVTTHVTTAWRVCGTGLPQVRRRCPDCRADRFAATGRFRVNANGKLLDVWLLIRCVGCAGNARLKIHHRVNVDRLPPQRLRGYTENDPELLDEVLRDPSTARHNHCTLDWSEVWELICPPPPVRAAPWITVDVQFDIPAPVRPVRLIAQGLQLSRGQVEQMIADRRITSAIDLRRKTSSSFSFTFTRGAS